ncbi:winged helix-turn-helix transcriptional regulator [Halolamina sp. CBA1230]|nr:winged helix-turn-helix transcriptional regulator [Halolamina sp. CBA1230]
MEGVLWYVLASSRGGPTRVRILRAIDERPRNANQLAETLDLDYTTVRHHLDVLLENNVVRKSGDEYAAVYLFTEQVRSNWHTVEEILDTVDPDGPELGAENADTGTEDDESGAETDDAGTEEP